MTTREFLDRFFGPGNLIDRNQVQETPELRDLTTDLSERLEIPAVLPRRRTEDDVDWFVLCGDDTALRRVSAELQGFIGPTYARWSGTHLPLDVSDPVERAVNELSGGRAIRFRTSSNAEFKDCWTAIKLMRGTWRQRPAHQVEHVRTGAALVRDFELAIAAGDAETASDRIAELRRRGLIGAENLRFLEIRQLAAQGRWREIASEPDLPDLSRIRRPWLVTEDLLTALYRVRLAQYEVAHDVNGAVEAAADLISSFPELYGALGPLRSPDVAKSFALRHSVPGRTDPQRLAELRDMPGLGASDRAWIEAIADAVAPPARPTPDAREAFARGDIDAAFALARSAAPSAGRAELLVECAFELQTLDSAQAAVTAIAGLSVDERDAVLARRLIAVAVERLQVLVEPPADADAAPTTWTAWLRRLLDDPTWRAADAVAACGELEYSAEDLVDPSAAEELGALILAAADSSGRQAFRDGLPRIVSWLDRRDLDPAVARPIHVAVLTVLALDSAWGESSLEAAYNGCEALLRSGLDQQAYAELLEQLGLLWERMAARAHVAWLADLFELLELYPGPRDELIGFVAAAGQRVLGFADRIDVSVASALERSCAALGNADLARAITARAAKATPSADAEAVDLSGRLVGIYTLTPQVGVRAREAIERRFPGVRVEVDSSPVSTRALEHLAASADYLIVSIRSAKHAATDAIDRHRPREMPTLIPRGRGSTRMVEALATAVGAGQ